MKQIKYSLALMLAISVFGCTKERKAEFPDGVGSDLLEKVEILNAPASILLAPGSDSSKTTGKIFKLDDNAPALKVVDYNGPQKLAALFKDLSITGEAGKRYNIKFELTRKYLTVSKIVRKGDQLTPYENELSKPVGDSKQVPIMSYPVKGYGIVIKQKNEFKEETATLRFQSTELDDASHIQISTLVADRILIAPIDTDKSELFLANKIDGSLLKAKDIQATGININLDLNPDALIYTKLDQKGIHIYEVTKLEDLTTAEREKAKNATSALYKVCPKEVSESKEVKSPVDCILREAYIVGVEFIKPKREVRDGLETPSVTYDPSNFKETNLVRIRLQPAVQLIIDDGKSQYVHLGNLLKVSDIRDKKFSYGIILEDSPNLFEHVFPGLAGNLEIISIEFLKNSVQFVRDRAIRKVKVSTAVDKEILASYPAIYLVRITKDSQGMPLLNPRYETATSSHPDALVEISWDSNQVANVNSPMDYYSVEKCFDGKQSVNLASFENSLSNLGFIALSLDTTYLASRSRDCVGLGAKGYFDRSQSTFSFRERITLKEYKTPAGGEQKPLFSMPLAAQRKFGFGLFTYKLETPNSSDQVGLEGTELALPAVFDIRNGKTIDYVLAGLPEDGEIRTNIIGSTAEVIRDLNLAYSKALGGTPMERNTPVLRLLVQEATQAELDDAQKAFKISVPITVSSRIGKLGDIDRNYIWFVGKTTKSTVIGLGGAQVNPRNGFVESGSVYIYGGNIIGYAEYLKKQKKFHENYLAKSQIRDVPKSGAAPVSGTAPGAGPGPGSGSTPSSPDSHISLDVSKNTGPINLALLRKAIDSGIVKDGAPVRNKALYDNLVGLIGSMDPLSRSFFEATAIAQRDGQLGSEAAILANYRNRKIENIVGQNRDEKSTRLLGRLNQEKAIDETLNSLKNSCAYTTASIGVEAATAVLEQEDGVTRLIVGIYKSTLAHEIGHNLGLRHNFIGSFDKQNWKFTDKDESTRDYSSVMDYIPDHHVTYEGKGAAYGGMGPQDIHALRASYTGLVELEPKLLAAATFQKALLKNPNGDVFLADDEGKPLIQIFGNLQEGFKFVSLEDIRSKIMGVANWNAFSRISIDDIQSRLPLKSYMFCTDEDADGSPACNRFDKGGTPLEIVENYISEYKALYAYRNIVNDRLDFTNEDDGSYVSRVLGTFLPIRKMLEETIFMVSKGQRQEVGTYVEAAVRAMRFFHEVIRTPDAEDLNSFSHRFVNIQLKDKIVPVERKFLKSFRTDFDSDQIWVRGIELDKAFALIMLTTRELGIPRYEQASIRVSFPLFEKLIGLSPVDKPADIAPTLSLLRNMLDDHLRPAVLVPSLNGYFNLPTSFSSNISEIMRMYAIIGSIVNQDVSGLEANDNLSRLFRVMNSSRKPHGSTPSVVEAGVSEGERGAIYYFPPDSALAAQKLIARVDSIDSLVKNKKSLIQAVKNYDEKLGTLEALRKKVLTVPASPPGQNDTPVPTAAPTLTGPPPADASVPVPPPPSQLVVEDPIKKLEGEISEIEMLFNKTLGSFSDVIGLKKLKDIVSVRDGFIAKLVQLENDETSGLIESDEVEAQLALAKTEISEKIKMSPSLELAFEAVDATKIKANYYENAAPSMDSERRRGVVFRNIQLLNQLFYSIHSEYRN